jgi:hypothetical protein
MRLFVRLVELAAFWTVANAGFFFIADTFGYTVSYNEQPLLFSLYYIFWALVVLMYYAALFRSWMPHREDARVLMYESAAFTTLVWGLLYVLSQLPTVTGPKIAPYTDLMLSSWWFFLPKSAEILVQQLLITVLLVTLKDYVGTFSRIVLAYAVTFGGLHAAVYALASAPAPYETVMTLAAIGSSLIFPYFILRVRGGFIHAYAFHLVFYIILGMVMHSWPPPEYVQLFTQQSLLYAILEL